MTEKYNSAFEAAVTGPLNVAASLFWWASFFVALPFSASTKSNLDLKIMEPAEMLDKELRDGEQR